jgi:hypothetical protein
MDGGTDEARVAPGEATDERRQDENCRGTPEPRATSNARAGQAGQADLSCDGEWLLDDWAWDELLLEGDLMRAVSSDDELAEAPAAPPPAVDKGERPHDSLGDGCDTLQEVGGTDSGGRFGPEHLAILETFGSVFPDQVADQEDASIWRGSLQAPVAADHPAEAVQVVDRPTVVMTCKQCDHPAEKGNYGFCLQHRKKARTSCKECDRPPVEGNYGFCATHREQCARKVQWMCKRCNRVHMAQSNSSDGVVRIRCRTCDPTRQHTNWKRLHQRPPQSPDSSDGDV